MLFAVSDTTLIILAQIASVTVITVFGYIFKKGLEENTKITQQSAQAIQNAAVHARQASAVGKETLKGVIAAAVKAEEATVKAENVEQQVRELQEESGLLKKNGDHIRGDEPGK